MNESPQPHSITYVHSSLLQSSLSSFAQHCLLIFHISLCAIATLPLCSSLPVPSSLSTISTMSAYTLQSSDDQTFTVDRDMIKHAGAIEKMVTVSIPSRFHFPTSPNPNTRPYLWVPPIVALRFSNRLTRIHLYLTLTIAYHHYKKTFWYPELSTISPSSLTNCQLPSIHWSIPSREATYDNTHTLFCLLSKRTNVHNPPILSVVLILRLCPYP